MKTLHLHSLLFLVGALVAGCWPGNVQQDVQPLKQLQLVKALPVDMPGPLEPSGLTLWEGNLYTVADKDNGTIYKVVLDEKSATLVPFRRFDPPPGYAMDWEGITVDQQGNFYLISESYARIAIVTPDGECDWVSPDLSMVASEVGLFQRPNAGFEGIVRLGKDHFIGAVEREPRGLVEYRKVDDRDIITPSTHEHSPFNTELNLLRIPDYSGLCLDNDTLYGLFRNAHLVVKLERIEGVLQETEAWSYRHIETNPEWAFLAQTYGQAEGLAVSGNDVYLIFDNNLGGRQINTGDGRPLFVHARFP